MPTRMCTLMCAQLCAQRSKACVIVYHSLAIPLMEVSP